MPAGAAPLDPPTWIRPVVTRSADRLAPVLPNDGLSFGELARSYNFENVSGRGLVLTRLITDACRSCRRTGSSLRAIDIGCGRGIEHDSDYQWAVRDDVDELWGVEPDPEIQPPDGLFSAYINASLERAELPDDHFDVAYSFMVMEHVTNPDEFMRVVHRCLKPGGVYLFATPNGRHYFTRIASLLRKLHLDETVLRMTVGPASDEYHYPVHYRFNSERRIRQTAIKIGFDPPEFVYLEGEGPIDYFPKPLRFVYHALRAKRRVVRNPRSLMTMVCRAAKPR
jgi:SAM-dependent methyltransferase